MGVGKQSDGETNYEPKRAPPAADGGICKRCAGRACFVALRFAAVAEPRKRDFVCGAVLNRRVFIIP